MDAILKRTVEPVWPQPRSSRWVSGVVHAHADPAALAGGNNIRFAAAGQSFFGLGLLGLADDQGVRLNGGRAGARLGPDAFRAALAGYGAIEPVALDAFNIPVVDLGNIRPGKNLGQTHDRVSEIVTAMLVIGLMPIGIGGGHDLTFPVVRAVVDRMIPTAASKLDGVYFDAHLDVRETDGSGMPFRRLIEHGGIGTLHLFGMDPLSNSIAHLNWFRRQGGQLADWQPDQWPAGPAQFVSVCLDVIDMAQAPGVSAPAPVGWPASRLAEYVEAAGRNPSVCCFDIMELCPPNDENGRTARLAAYLFMRFVAGLNQRVRVQPNA